MLLVDSLTRRDAESITAQPSIKPNSSVSAGLSTPIGGRTKHLVCDRKVKSASKDIRWVALRYGSLCTLDCSSSSVAKPRRCTRNVCERYVCLAYRLSRKLVLLIGHHCCVCDVWAALDRIYAGLEMKYQTSCEMKYAP